MNDVTDVRRTLSKRFLSISDASVSELSLVCGYKNTEHFIRQFKSKEGVTPLSFGKTFSQNK